jgi:hypothetical protein
MSRVSNLFLSALLVTAAVPAQQMACVRGLVERAPALSICNVRGTHYFRCQNLYLNSTTIDLTQFENQVVEVCGTVAGAGTCRLMSVGAVNSPVDQITIAGPVNGRIAQGSPVTFNLGVTPATPFVLLYSNRTGWLDTGSAGFLLIDTRFFVFATGILDGMGQASIAGQIPMDQSLVNLTLHFQPAMIDLTQFAPHLANADCFQIR